MKYVDLCKKNSEAIYVTKNTKPPFIKGFVKVLLVLAVFIGGAVFIFKDKILSAFNPVSIINSVTKIDLKETDGRTNILILGSDRRDAGAEAGRNILTDTILVASIGRVDNDVVMISLPRDLWVKSPNGYSGKINAVYAMSEEGTNSQNIRTVVEDVLGIPIHYHVLVSFELFKEIVDILGGIDVDVERSFTDSQYPIEGKENAPLNERYETITFSAGLQTMDGNTALKYIRSRHGDNEENTDFARSRRQQKVITAIKNKALSVKTLLNPVKIKELYDAYASNTDTDIGVSSINSFYLLSQQINFNRVVSVVLDDRSSPENGGLLYEPVDKTLYSNQYVLLPQTGNYTQIHAFVQRYLFGGK